MALIYKAGHAKGEVNLGQANSLNVIAGTSVKEASCALAQRFVDLGTVRDTLPVQVLVWFYRDDRGNVFERRENCLIAGVNLNDAEDVRSKIQAEVLRVVEKLRREHFYVSGTRICHVETRLGYDVVKWGDLQRAASRRRNARR